MTAIAHQPLQRAGAERGVPGALAVRWEISASALLVSPGAAILNGQAAKLRACALVVRVERDVARAELDLELVGGEKSVIALGNAARVEWWEEGGMVAIDAAGVVAMTLRGDEVMYARTPVLAGVLGLMGGVYDAPVVV